MSGALRKGWCPGALRPMAAKDGLLVRLRLTGGILPADTALALADLATRHGNGLFDLSARGNLQMRGVRDASLPALHDNLDALGLLDADAAAESVRNVIASPLAGLHPGLDIMPLVAALEDCLTRDKALHDLPGKFGFVIDDGSTPSLGGIDADIRFDWIAERAVFSIGLGGMRDDALRVGPCAPEGLVEAATKIARLALGLFAQRPDLRRMRGLIAAFGSAEVANLYGDGIADTSLDPIATTQAEDIVGIRNFDGVQALGLAAPFGRLDHAMLRDAATLAMQSDWHEIRLTPWRTMQVVIASEAKQPRSQRSAPGLLRCARNDNEESTAPHGFIVDPHDPRLAIAACVGVEGCANGTTPTHEDAAALANLVKAFDGRGTKLHLSGCEKGCAKPSSSPLTLVGREGCYDLVRNGRAGDPPDLRSLDLDAARAAIAALLEPA